MNTNPALTFTCERFFDGVDALHRRYLATASTRDTVYGASAYLRLRAACITGAATKRLAAEAVAEAVQAGLSKRGAPADLTARMLAHAASTPLTAEEVAVAFAFWVITCDGRLEVDRFAGPVGVDRHRLGPRIPASSTDPTPHLGLDPNTVYIIKAGGGRWATIYAGPGVDLDPDLARVPRWQCYEGDTYAELHSTREDAVDDAGAIARHVAAICGQAASTATRRAG